MKKSLISAVCALFLVSCSAPYRDAPRAVNFGKSDQKKIQAMAHWKIIAKDISDTLVKKKISSVYIIENYKTEFEKVLAKMIKSDLINKGVVVKNKKVNTKVLEISVNTIEFSKNRDLWNDKQGLGALLGGGVYLATITPAVVAVPGAVVAGEATYAYKSKYSNTPQYEIDVNIDIKDNDRYYASVNKVYYIADDDANLYRVKNYKSLKVKGE